MDAGSSSDGLLAIRIGNQLGVAEQTTTNSLDRKPKWGALGRTSKTSWTTRTGLWGPCTCVPPFVDILLRDSGVCAEPIWPESGPR